MSRSKQESKHVASNLNLLNSKPFVTKRSKYNNHRLYEFYTCFEIKHLFKTNLCHFLKKIN